MGGLPEFCGVGFHRGACISAELRGGAAESWAAHQILARDDPRERSGFAWLVSVTGKLL